MIQKLSEMQVEVRQRLEFREVARRPIPERRSKRPVDVWLRKRGVLIGWALMALSALSVVWAAWWLL